MEGTSQLLFLSLLLNTVMECASKLLLLFQELLRRQEFVLSAASLRRSDKGLVSLDLVTIASDAFGDADIAVNHLVRRKSLVARQM